ncbi:MAG: TonB-dependent receptor [Sandaracinaceae bacterium]|nr:TonB-dependent receptor [Sandaracinaceae bacterium]
MHSHPHEHEEPELGVTATVRPPREAPPLPSAASELEIEPGLLADVPRRSAEDLLTLAPGVLVTNHGGEGHAPGLYLRGFDAGEGQDVEVLVDGIPINEPSNAHGHGYADARFVVPELVRSLRVLQGPFDPRQGDFAVAGTVEYRLGMSRRGVLARGEVGMFDTRRLVLAWAPEGMSDGTFVGVELRDGAGFGPNRAYFGAGVLGRFEHRIDRELSFFVLAASQAADNDSAGVIRQDDVLAGRLTCGSAESFFCAADPSQGGSTSRHLAALGLEWRRPSERFTQVIWGGFRDLRVRENFTGQLLDERGDGLDQQYQAGTVGLRGSYRVRIPWLERDQHVEVGYLARHDAGETRAVRLRRELGTPYATLFDAGLNVTDIGAWLLAELRPLAWLSLRAGLRVDAFHFAVDDRALPTADRMGERLPTESRDAFGVAVQPRGSLRIELVEGLDWITSAGAGARSSDAVALSDGERAPFAQVVATETGLALELRERRAYRLSASAALFHTYVDRDLRFDPTRGRNVLAGASNRFGASVYGRVRVEDWLDAAASVAWTEANQGEVGWLELGSGDRLPFVPRLTGRVDVALRKRFSIDGEPFSIGAAAGVTWIGPRPLPNGAEGGAYAVTDASAHVGWRFAEVGVMVTNLFDVRYERASFAYVSRFDLDAATSMTPARHLAAGPPLTVLATLTLRLTPLEWLTGQAPLRPEDEE